jgi:predicted transcriptional regulator of viral defense system
MTPAKTILRLKGNTFSRKQIEALGLTGNHIQELLKSGQIVRLHRGVYQISGENLSDEEIFHAASIRLKGRSAVCLLSALAYYNLTDAIPKKTWLMVDEQTHSSYKDIRVCRTRNPNWKIGIVENKNYSITSIERTLVDCLVYKKIIGTNVAISAIKSAIREKKTTLSKIAKMSQLLGVEHRIYQYIESLP